ncbi:MAG: TonB-dependent receptor [Bacteroidetes bacterium]|nr:TonB-dependent receptor [Bacteroidota bacterium]
MYKLIFKYTAGLLMILWPASALTQTLTGTVLNTENGQPVPYATIYVIELSSGTLTDSLGNFKITNFPSSPVTLKVSAVGFNTAQTIITGGASENKLQISLEPAHVHLDEVVVSAPFGRLQHENVTNVEIRRLNDLNRIPATTLSEAISTIPGVYQSSTGNGIGKPVIRGLSGTRVVTYLNGLRIENQQWGDDHGMGVTAVGIESVEVIKGPASLLYGSDALGGVLYFVNQSYSKLNRFEGYFQTKFETNALGVTSELGLKWNKNGFKFNVFAGQTNQADYLLPNGYRIQNSRFSNTTLKSSVGYNKKNWVGNLHYSFIQNYIGIPGETEEDSIYPALFYTNAVTWSKGLPFQNVTNHYVSLENKFFFSNSELEFIVGNTNNHLQELEESFTLPGLNLKLNNSTYTLRYTISLLKKLEAIVGSQGMYQVNQNGANAAEILIPDNRSFDAGLYAVLQLELQKWTFQGGARFDNRKIATQADFNGFEIFDRSYQSYNYSAGFVFRNDSTVFRFNLSSGFRAPHTSELLSNGVHPGTYRYNLGDPDLRTENATQADFSIGVHYDHLELVFNPFFNQINNYIYLNPTDSVINGYQVFKYSQTGKAQLFGGDLTLHIHPHFAHWIHLQTAFSYIYGQDETGKALPFIPQARINSQLKFELPGSRRFRITDVVVQHSFYFGQNRVGLFETPTDAYHLFHLGMNLSIHTKGNPVLLNCGVRNALNTTYFDHLSSLKQIGLPFPGINGYISLKYTFERKLKEKAER